MWSVPNPETLRKTAAPLADQLEFEQDVVQQLLLALVAGANRLDQLIELALAIAGQQKRFLGLHQELNEIAVVSRTNHLQLQMC